MYAKNKQERQKMKLDIEFILKNCPKHLINKEISVNDYFDDEDGENPFRTSSPDRKARPFSIRRALGGKQHEITGKLRFSSLGIHSIFQNIDLVLQSVLSK